MPLLPTRIYVALRLPLLLAGLILAGCASTIDPDQARICRLIVPALNPEARSITIESAAPGHRPYSLRIGYAVTDREGATRNRAATCLFASGGLDARKGELIGVTTEEGPLSEAAFYFLKRFWLEDRQTPRQDPGPPPRTDLPKLSPAAGYALQQAIVALPMAATYAMLAAGYALIYGLIGRILLTFGEFAALGSLAGVVGVASTLSLALVTPMEAILTALAFALATAALHGYAAGRMAISRLMAHGTGQQVLIGSLGLSLALSEYLRLAVGPQLRWLPPAYNTPMELADAGQFTVTATPISLGAAGLGLMAAVTLLVWMRHSDYGRAWRALSDDPKAAALCGIDAGQVRDRAFILACALAGLAGLVVTLVHGGFGFAGGFVLSLKALIAAILGGIGSVPGAILGGLALAAFEAAWSATLPIEQRDLAVFCLLSLILVMRPGGFFGHGRLAPREV